MRKVVKGGLSSHLLILHRVSGRVCGRGEAVSSKPGNERAGKVHECGELRLESQSQWKPNVGCLKGPRKNFEKTHSYSNKC